MKANIDISSYDRCSRRRIKHNGKSLAKITSDVPSWTHVHLHLYTHTRSQAYARFDTTFTDMIVCGDHDIYNSHKCNQSKLYVILQKLRVKIQISSPLLSEPKLTSSEKHFLWNRDDCVATDRWQQPMTVHDTCCHACIVVDAITVAGMARSAT